MRVLEAAGAAVAGYAKEMVAGLCRTVGRGLSKPFSAREVGSRSFAVVCAFPGWLRAPPASEVAASPMEVAGASRTEGRSGWIKKLYVGGGPSGAGSSAGAKRSCGTKSVTEGFRTMDARASVPTSLSAAVSSRMMASMLEKVACKVLVRFVSLSVFGIRGHDGRIRRGGLKRSDCDCRARVVGDQSAAAVVEHTGYQMNRQPLVVVAVEVCKTQRWSPMLFWWCLTKRGFGASVPHWCKAPIRIEYFHLLRDKC